jgi:hypothetical protein
MKIKTTFLLAIALYLSFILLSCNGNTTEPETPGGGSFNDSVLFIEYGVEAEAYYNNGNRMHYGGAYPRDVYKFNEHDHSLEVDSYYADPLDPSTKLIFGTYVTSSFRYEKFIQETDFPAWEGLGGYYNIHLIEVTDSTPKGEIKVTYTPAGKEEIILTLKPGDIFQNVQIGSRSYPPSSTYSYTDVITIANKGFVKRSNVTYYSSY